MLALRNAKVPTTLGCTFAKYGSALAFTAMSSPLLAASSVPLMRKCIHTEMLWPNVANVNVIVFAGITKTLPVDYFGKARSYATDKDDCGHTESSSTTSRQRATSAATPSSASPTPTLKLPERAQVEKWFFRTLAFIYDTSTIVITWTFQNIQKYIVENPTVQMYWKQLHQKMENSKKG